MSDDLEKARKYESENLKQIPKGQKPAFHVCAPVGWINDPNGFSEYQEEYHLFYQYHPYKTVWGPMHWGHSKSKDFIRWEQLPCALAPDSVFDIHGCFSGSAIEHDGKHVLMYTGVTERVQEDGTKEYPQAQCIAIGNGIDYEKLNCNPIITSEFLPEGSSNNDFRDPKIWAEGDSFYAVAASRSADHSGQIPLFTSKDLRTWTYDGIIDRSLNKIGEMWECPDFFELDGKQVLVISPQEMKAEGLEYHNGNGTISIIGIYNKETHELVREYMSTIDYGLDFYAPQTMKTRDGRRIMIAWLQNWDNFITPPHFKWSGIMTIPREFQINKGRLIQNPVSELKNYYQNEVIHENVTFDKKTEFKGIRGRQLDLTVEVAAGNYEAISMFVASGEEFFSELRYEPVKNIVTFDRTYSGISKDILHKRSMFVKDQGGKIKLRILMDKYSVEVFVNDGEQAMTSLIYTPLESDRILFNGEGEVICNIIKHDVVVE